LLNLPLTRVVVLTLLINLGLQVKNLPLLFLLEKLELFLETLVKLFLFLVSLA